MVARAYGSVWRFLGSIRRYLLFTALAFLAVTVLGWMTAAMNPSFASDAMEGIASIFESKDLFEDAPGDGGADNEAAAQIQINAPRLIANNIIAMCYGVVMGFIPFLFLPVFPLLVNAALIGIMGGSLQGLGTGALVFAVAVLPHGIFEIPALLLAYSMGLCLCMTLARSIIRSRKARPVWETLRKILLTFSLVVIPMTVLAGIVEAYVTPAITFRFLGF